MASGYLPGLVALHAVPTAVRWMRENPSNSTRQDYSPIESWYIQVGNGAGVCSGLGAAYGSIQLLEKGNPLGIVYPGLLALTNIASLGIELFTWIKSKRSSRLEEITTENDISSQ